MKKRVIFLALSVLTVCITIASCQTVPAVKTEESVFSDSSEQAFGISSSEESFDAESSAEISQYAVSESSDEFSEESSEEPSEESSDVIVLPYPVIEELNKENIGASEYDSFFNDSMFVGHSIIEDFRIFLDNMRYKNPGFLGNAFTFAACSWSARHDFDPMTDKYVHPKYKGEKMRCADAVAKSGVKKVFLTVMARNDLGMGGITTCVDETFGFTVRLIETIQEAAPDAEIIVLSCTYMTYRTNLEYQPNGKKARNHNGNISALNNKVLDYCSLHGLDFIDVSTDLMDGNVMKKEYSRDDDMHLYNDSYAKWIGILRNYVYLKQMNAYKNPESMPTYTFNID